MLSRARAAALMTLTLAALAACGGKSGTALVEPSPFCVTTVPPVARAFIGPDVIVRARCGSKATAPIASVDATGAGLVTWSVSLQGDSAFVGSSTQATCALKGPTVAFVAFVPPADAAPGATFETVATVHAVDGSFADGTVKVRGEVVPPTVTVDRSHIDFGDVAPGAEASATITFSFKPGDTVFIQPTVSVASPITLSMTAAPDFGAKVPMTQWLVTFRSSVPGDYALPIAWTGQLVSLPTPCPWTGTITVHAHVQGDARDGGDEGMDDGGPADGGADAEADAP
jgi:hypothetical protein